MQRPSPHSSSGHGSTGPSYRRGSKSVKAQSGLMCTKESISPKSPNSSLSSERRFGSLMHGYLGDQHSKYIAKEIMAEIAGPGRDLCVI